MIFLNIQNSYTYHVGKTSLNNKCCNKIYHQLRLMRNINISPLISALWRAQNMLCKYTLLSDNADYSVRIIKYRYISAL